MKNCLRGDSSEECTVIDLYTSIHDSEKTVLTGICGGFPVDDAELHPYRSGPDLDGLFDNRVHIFRSSEDIDNIDMLRDRYEIWIAFQPQDLGVSRVHWKKGVSGAEKIPAHHVAGPVFLGRQTDDGDRPGLTQKVADLHMGVELNHGGSCSRIWETAGYERRKMIYQ